MSGSGAGFRAEQRGVAIRMGAALLITVATLALALVFGGYDSPAARLGTLVAVDSVVVAWLAAAIGNVARLRFFSPDDIAGSAGSNAGTPIRNASAILQNTLEQVALAIPVHIALAFSTDRAGVPLIVLGALFSLGRLLFWRGYAGGAKARALGFALTFYPSVGALLVVIAIVTAPVVYGLSVRASSASITGTPSRIG